LKQKGTTAAAATGTNTTRPSNQKGRISATAAVAAAIGPTTAAPTKQKGGGTIDSNDLGIPEKNAHQSVLYHSKTFYTPGG
jgi:hypothetical protein